MAPGSGILTCFCVAMPDCSRTSPPVGLTRALVVERPHGQSAATVVVVALCIGLVGCVGSSVAEQSAASTDPAPQLPLVSGVEPQPVLAHATRLHEALALVGSRLSADDARQVDAWRTRRHTPELVAEIQTLFDRHCLAMVHINPEARVRAERGPARAELLQEGWQTFLVKVHNEAGVTAPLEIHCPNALPLSRPSTNEPVPARDPELTAGDLANRFLHVQVVRSRPLFATLSGLELEYAVVQIYARAAGRREARFAFDVGQGTGDLGFRASLDILFDCRPAVRTVLRVRDADGSPTMAAFYIADHSDRTAADGGASLVDFYPLPSRRSARTDEFPDFFFQPQVYRQDGEHVYLSPGTYEFTVRRGPEYLPLQRTATIPAGVDEHEVAFDLVRWIHMAELGWYSVDHHVHAAGCSHYDAPTQGVLPEDMWRQGLGEDLNVSCVLSWGPCWYFQKGFFEGRVHPLSTERNLLRYDVEVSGFPSSHAGHVCLLRLREDDYPGTTRIEQWPSWTLPILQWGKQQGSVVGYAHSGLGLEPIEPTAELPNTVPARFDGIGANEYIVTVTHEAVDFIATGDTPALWELNIWYHTLNCGFRTRISGETDFPCISDARIGCARSYVRLPGALDFDACVEQIKKGRSYVSDGASHIVDFCVDEVELGMRGSELRLERPGSVTVRARVAAYLPETSPLTSTAPPAWSRLTWYEGTPAELQEFYDDQPHWDLEKARIGDSRRVRLELLCNGAPVAHREIVADGKWNPVEFDLQLDRSSWLALRVHPSSHTNPVFVLVGDRPIRASAASAQWCRDGVDRCWAQKQGLFVGADRAAAERGYEHARRTYERILEEARAEAKD